ncbi:MAG: adenylate kinase [Elusimicrobia bacterium]|nr:adenylate kinase [Elusimicrobiota bacterium]
MAIISVMKLNNTLDTFFRSFTFALSLILFGNNCLLAYSPEINFWNERQKSIKGNEPPRSTEILARTPTTTSQFSFPYGNLRKIQEPKTLPPHARTILHIQDIHMNLEAQKNIGKLVETLLAQNQVELMALEGASGPIEISRFKQFPFPATLKEKADLFLKENKISGPIHAALRSPFQAPILGIDDETHYQANIDAYRRASKLMGSMKVQIKKERENLRLEEENRLNPALKMRVRKMEMYQAGDLSLAGYIEWLLAQTPHQTGVGQNVKRFAEALKIEQSLDLNSVEKDRNLLMGQLLPKISGRETSELAEKIKAYKQGHLLDSEFYAFIESLSRRQGVILTSTPHLSRYIRYLNLSESVDGEALFKEVNDLEERVMGTAIITTEERTLLAQLKKLSLREKLVNFSLTKEEWDEYKTFPSHGSQGGGRQTRLAEESQEGTLSAFEDFYQEAEQRDGAMARHLLSAINAAEAAQKTSTAQKPILLVTGGFHSAGLARELTKGGHRVLTYVPKITHINKEEATRYLSVFSQEKTPLDKLFEGQPLFLSPHPFSPAKRLELAQQLLATRPTFRSLAWFFNPIRAPQIPSLSSIKNNLAQIIQLNRRPGTPLGRGLGSIWNGTVLKAKLLWIKTMASLLPPMNLILIGPPAAGKGTQAKIIESTFGSKQLSTGDMLRNMRGSGNELGKEINDIMLKGEMVNDGLVNEIVFHFISRLNNQSFFLDGYPRNVDQARVLTSFLSENNISIDAVIYFDVDLEKLFARVDERRKKENRADDNSEVFRNRLKVYEEVTLPVVDYYRSHPGFRSINAEKSIDEVTADIGLALVWIGLKKRLGQHRRFFIVSGLLLSGFLFYFSPASASVLGLMAILMSVNIPAGEEDQYIETLISEIKGFKEGLLPNTTLTDLREILQLLNDEIGNRTMPSAPQFDPTDYSIQARLAREWLSFKSELISRVKQACKESFETENPNFQALGNLGRTAHPHLPEVGAHIISGMTAWATQVPIDDDTTVEKALETFAGHENTNSEFSMMFNEARSTIEATRKANREEREKRRKAAEKSVNASNSVVVPPPNHTEPKKKPKSPPVESAPQSFIDSIIRKQRQSNHDRISFLEDFIKDPVFGPAICDRALTKFQALDAEGAITLDEREQASLRDKLNPEKNIRWSDRAALVSYLEQEHGVRFRQIPRPYGIMESHKMRRLRLEINASYKAHNPSQPIDDLVESSIFWLRENFNPNPNQREDVELAQYFAFVKLVLIKGSGHDISKVSNIIQRYRDLIPTLNAYYEKNPEQKERIHRYYQTMAHDFSDALPNAPDLISKSLERLSRLTLNIQELLSIKKSQDEIQAVAALILFLRLFPGFISFFLNTQVNIVRVCREKKIIKDPTTIEKAAGLIVGTYILLGRQNQSISVLVYNSDLSDKNWSFSFLELLFVFMDIQIILSDQQKRDAPDDSSHPLQLSSRNIFPGVDVNFARWYTEAVQREQNGIHQEFRFFDRTTWSPRAVAVLGGFYEDGIRRALFQEGITALVMMGIIWAWGLSLSALTAVQIERLALLFLVVKLILWLAGAFYFATLDHPTVVYGGEKQERALPYWVPSDSIFKVKLPFNRIHMLITGISNGLITLLPTVELVMLAFLDSDNLFPGLILYGVLSLFLYALVGGSHAHSNDDAHSSRDLLMLGHIDPLWLISGFFLVLASFAWGGVVYVSTWLKEQNPLFIFSWKRKQEEKGRKVTPKPIVRTTRTKAFQHQAPIKEGMGQTENAIKDNTAILQLFKDSTTSSEKDRWFTSANQLAVTYLEQKNYQDGIVVLSKALEIIENSRRYPLTDDLARVLDRQEPILRTTLARLYRNNGQVEQALSTLSVDGKPHPSIKEDQIAMNLFNSLHKRLDTIKGWAQHYIDHLFRIVGNHHGADSDQENAFWPLQTNEISADFITTLPLNREVDLIDQIKANLSKALAINPTFMQWRRAALENDRHAFSPLATLSENKAMQFLLETRIETQAHINQEKNKIQKALNSLPAGSTLYLPIKRSLASECGKAFALSPEDRDQNKKIEFIYANHSFYIQNATAFNLNLALDALPKDQGLLYVGLQTDRFAVDFKYLKERNIQFIALDEMISGWVGAQVSRLVIERFNAFTRALIAA